MKKSSNQLEKTPKTRGGSSSSSRSPSPSLSPSPKRYSRTPTPQTQRMKNYFTSKLFPFDSLDYILFSFMGFFLIGYLLNSNQHIIEKYQLYEKYPDYFSNLKYTYIELEFLTIIIFLFKKFFLLRMKSLFGI